jgi:ribonucleoside-diphosphate reductase alpha chain
VITTNAYPLPQSEEISQMTRKIGLGIMGFADMLYKMGIKYDSEEGLVWAKKIMQFIQEEAHKASGHLAVERGDFPAWKKSVFGKQKKRMRNATLTCILPTGTMSLIADVSPGLEPNFALCFLRKALDGRELVYTNDYFKHVLQQEGLYSETLLRAIAKQGTIQHMKDIPKKIRDVFVTAQDINALWHIRMQAAFQEYTDNAISKTINFDAAATVRDVEEGFLAAWEQGCKGVTIYREGSMEAQIINFHRSGEPPAKKKKKRQKKSQKNDSRKKAVSPPSTKKKKPKKQKKIT